MRLRRPPRSPGLIATIAFVGHHPGVRILCGLHQRRRTRSINLAALGAAFAATGLALALAPSASAAYWGLGTFAVGHFVWSTMYAAIILQNPEGTFENWSGP